MLSNIFFGLIGWGAFLLLLGAIELVDGWFQKTGQKAGGRSGKKLL